jgi:hypothetical protein
MKKKCNVACENAFQDQNTQKICLNAGNVGKSNFKESKCQIMHP